MDQDKTKYSAFLTRLQEELMTAATQHAVAWRFGNWSARERLLTVHERLLRDVRKNLQRLNTMVLKETPGIQARVRGRIPTVGASAPASSERTTRIVEGLH